MTRAAAQDCSAHISWLKSENLTWQEFIVIMVITSNSCSPSASGNTLTCQFNSILRLIIFYSSIFRNPLVPCDAITIPRINLLPWKEGLKIFSPTQFLFNDTLRDSNIVIQKTTEEVQRQPKESKLDDETAPSSDFNIDINFG